MVEENFKYNYVIVGAPGYYLVGYKDVINLSNVSYHTDYYDGFSSALFRRIVRLNFSQKVNSFIKTPFSKIVYPKLYPHSFRDERPICFIFFSGTYYVLQSSYLEYIKKKYNAKTVLFCQDLLERNKFLDIDKVRNKMDLMITYDRAESIKYGMDWHPTPMSYVPIQPTKEIPQSDFYYCGYGKSRYPVIHEVYKKLTSLGYNCDFNLMYMPSGAPHIKGINYPNRFFNYEENLMHVCNSKCVLEIMQEGADGFTPRLWECIMYDKHLLTNNKTVWSSDFFTPEGVHHLDEIDSGMVNNWINSNVSFSNEMKESLSPIHLLEFIEKRI